MGGFICCDPGETRTHDQWLKRLLIHWRVCPSNQCLFFNIPPFFVVSTRGNSYFHID